MASNPALELAETIQTASINRAPSPTHDLNPSTAASEKQPVKASHAPASDSSADKYVYDDEDGIDVEDVEDENGEDIPYSVLKPVRRRQSFGPLPDLRFEQSYLASIAHAKSNWMVAFITIRDQVLMPLLQGTVWSLALFGWKHWNRTAQLSGSSTGAKVRRWWYSTNNWSIPKWAEVGKDARFAAEVGDYYQNQSSAGAGD